MLRQILNFFNRHFACEHKQRQLTMIVREPVTYTRRAQYYCPSCEHSWNTWKLPDSISGTR